MEKSQFRFLKSLMETICPTGYEKDAAEIWREEARTFTDDVWSDSHGNSFAVVNKNSGTRVMFAGHVDEIGLMVSYVNGNGFIYFKTIGGWDPQILPGQRIDIKTKKGIIQGVIGRKPIHLLQQEERKKVIKIEDLWIDIGAKNKKEALSLVDIGDPAVISCGLINLRNKLIAGRAFDDRVGAFAVLEATRLISKMYPRVAVFAVATSQEEIGTRGAITSAYAIDPKVGIAVDVGFATDTPGSEADKKVVGDTKMGGGPIITRGPNINPVLFDLFLEVAKQKKIPYQITTSAGPTGTDARSIQITRSGVATGLVSIPNRYMHSPCEMIHLGDLDNVIKLLAYTVMKIKYETNFKV